MKVLNGCVRQLKNKGRLEKTGKISLSDDAKNMITKFPEEAIRETL